MSKTQQSDNFNKLIKISPVLLFSLFAVFVITSPLSFGETTPELFTKVTQISGASAPVEGTVPLIIENTPDFILDSETVTTNLNILDSKEINVTLFDKTYIFTLDRLDEDGLENYTWFGSNDDGNAVITAQGGKLVATINTPDGNFVVDANEDNYNHQVKSIALGKLVEAPHTFTQQVTAQASADSYYLSNISQVILRHDQFRPSNLEDNETVYVDVYVGYTKAVKDEYGSTTVDRKIINEIKNANYANIASRIPVEFVLAGSDDYQYTEKSTSSIDKNNLIVHTDGWLNKLRNEANSVDADILVLITEPSVSVTSYGCGVAGGPIAKTPDNSVVVVAYACLDGITLTHEMGHLFGAGHNRDDQVFGTDRSPFGQFSLDGYGYYDTNVNKRTVMSYDCDSSEFDAPDEGINVTCNPEEVWSDPDVDFFGTATATGNDDNYNARAIYGSGPYIASMQGGVQKYDNISPSGDFEWIGEFIDKIFNQGANVNMGATFDEPIHDSYPPTVTISDGTLTTDVVMSKSSSTFYTATHGLTTEVGEVTLKFSNAKDLALNDIVANPTSGGTIEVIIPDSTEPRIDTINREDPTTQATSESSLKFRVTFDEDVSGVDSTDFVTSGTATSSVTGVTANSAVQYDVAVTVTADGTISLGLISSGHGITDKATTPNDLTNTTPLNTAETYTVTLPDETAPVIDSVSFSPTTGTLTVDDTIVMTIDSDGTGYTASSISVNGVDVTTSNFQDNNNNTYSVDYIISKGDSSIAVDSQISISVELTDDASNTNTAYTTSPSATSSPAIDVNPPTFDSVLVYKLFEANATSTDLSTLVFEIPIISDDIDSSPTLGNNATGFVTLGDRVIEWNATDASGNSAYAYQDISILDRTAPDFTVIPANVTKEAKGEFTDVPIENAKATDYFLDKIVHNAIDYFTNGFPLGDTLVIWTANDTSTNTNSTTQKITIEDTTDPEITAPSDILVEYGEEVILIPAQASDYFLDKTIHNATGFEFPLGDTIVLWTANDTSNNIETDTQKVTLEDTTAPNIFIPGDISIEATDIQNYVDIGSASATDLFGFEINNNATSTEFELGDTFILWNATDINGNWNATTQKITIEDTTHPVIFAPANVTKAYTDVLTTVILEKATVYDLFLQSITNDIPVDNLYPIGTTIVNFTATDSTGNIGKNFTQITITITDNVAPIFDFYGLDVDQFPFSLTDVEGCEILNTRNYDCKTHNYISVGHDVIYSEFTIDNIRDDSLPVTTSVKYYEVDYDFENNFDINSPIPSKNGKALGVGHFFIIYTVEDSQGNAQHITDEVFATDW